MITFPLCEWTRTPLSGHTTDGSPQCPSDLTSERGVFGPGHSCGADCLALKQQDVDLSLAYIITEISWLTLNIQQKLDISYHHIFSQDI